MDPEREADSFEADRAEIIGAIEAECAAYFAKDYALWASYWVQEPRARRWNWHADVGMTLHAGWEENSQTIRNGMRRYPEPMVNDVRRDWQEFVIDHDLAWVIFDQYSEVTGDPFQVTGRQFEMRIMQRRDGRWLTACVSSLKPRSEVAVCPVVQVDAKARVVWHNPQARQRLGDHPGLVISGGRLRGRSRPTDRALQAAITWAAGTLGYAQKRDSLRDTAATGGALPVMDEESGDAPQILCWVMPTDGMILVTLDDEITLAQRIAAAGMVFRLSEGQTKLARLLVEGQDLAQAAAVLKVSVNTLRTQLRRIFDKTGVHSQAALTRLMLSIAPPLR